MKIHSLLLLILSAVFLPLNAATEKRLYPFASSGLSYPAAAGGNLILKWSDLEPQEGSYNWAPLDNAITSARNGGKKIVPRVYTNMSIFGQASPAWFFNAPGVQYYYSSPQAQSGGFKAPVPWDPVFKQKFGAFLTALGNRYDGEPVIDFFQSNAGGGLYGEMVLTGVEMRPAGWTSALQRDAIYHWIQRWAEAFPSTALSLSVNYLGYNLLEDATAYASAYGMYLQVNNAVQGSQVVASLTAHAPHTRVVMEIEDSASRTGSAFTNLIDQIFGYGFPIDYLVLHPTSFADAATAATLPDVNARLREPYVEDFGDGQAQSWTAVNGAWEIISGRYGFEATNGGANNLSVYSRVYSNYTYDVDMIWVWGNTQGVVFDYQDANNYYRVVGNANGDWFRLEKVQNGQVSIEATATRPINLYTSYWLSVIKHGAKTSVRLDGVPLMTNVGTPAFGVGKIGVYNSFNKCRFDNISVLSDAPATVALTTTSPAQLWRGGPTPITLAFARSGGNSAAPLRVPLVVSGDAVAGAHYAPAFPSELVFGSGQTTAALTVSPIATNDAAEASVTLGVAVPANFAPDSESGSSSVAWTLHARPYGVWRAERFSTSQLADALVSGDVADPDGDGIPNLLEYAFGGDPLAGGDRRPLLPVAGTDGESRLTLAYTEPAGRPDLVYLTEWTDDVSGGAWQSGAGVVAEIDRTEISGGQFVTMRAERPMSALPRQFMRVRVTRV